MAETKEAPSGLPEDESSPGAEFPRELPILALKNVVVFPSVVLPIHVSRDKSIAAIEAVLAGRRIIGLLTQRDESEDNPTAAGMYDVGTIGLILRVLKLPEGGARILIQGLSRYRVSRWIAEEPYFKAEVEALPEHDEDTLQTQATMRSVLDLFKQYVTLARTCPPRSSWRRTTSARAASLPTWWRRTSASPTRCARECWRRLTRSPA